MVLALAKYKGGDKMDEIKRVLVYYLERLEREELNKKISWVFDCKVRLVARYRKLKRACSKEKILKYHEENRRLSFFSEFVTYSFHKSRTTSTPAVCRVQVGHRNTMLFISLFMPLFPPVTEKLKLFIRMAAMRIKS